MRQATRVNNARGKEKPGVSDHERIFIFKLSILNYKKSNYHHINKSNEKKYTSQQQNDHKFQT